MATHIICRSTDSFTLMLSSYGKMWFVNTGLGLLLFLKICHLTKPFRWHQPSLSCMVKLMFGRARYFLTNLKKVWYKENHSNWRIGYQIWLCRTVLLHIYILSYIIRMFIFFRSRGVDVGNLEVGTLQAKRLNRSTATSRDWDQQQNTCMQQVHSLYELWVSWNIRFREFVWKLSV